MVTQRSGSIWLGYSLVAWPHQSISKSILSYHPSCSVAFAWEQWDKTICWWDILHYSRSQYCCHPRMNINTVSNSKVTWRNHDDVIKWKHFPSCWPFVRGIHRSPGNSPHTDQWRAALMFSLIGAWINDWVNNRGAGDLRPHRTHYDVIVMAIHQIWEGHSSLLVFH